MIKMKEKNRIIYYGKIYQTSDVFPLETNEDNVIKSFCQLYTFIIQTKFSLTSAVTEE